MKNGLSAIMLTVATAAIAVLILFWFMGDISSGISTPALAAPLSLTVTAVDPVVAPNDLDTLIMITGTGFTAVPTVTLGSTLLDDVGWVSSTTLTATVPWGLDAGVYTLTVTNPDGGMGSLPNAFTVTQGIGVWNASELYGGNIDQIIINPLTPTTLYATANDVGLFRSTDGGESWSFNSVWGHDLAIDPISPNRVYRVGPHSGGWLYRSEDAGDTWIPITATFPITQTSGRNCSAPYRLFAIPGTVYASACGRDGGESGLIKSEDYGDTWEPLMGGITDTQVTELAFHPTNPLTMYLGTASGNIFISHNGGQSWAFASKPLEDVSEIAVSPFGDNEVWVATGRQWLGVLKSTNAELTAWTPINDMSSAHIFFPPDVWGEVYSNTVFIASGECDNVKTTDGGDTWEFFGPENGGIALALHPSNPNILYGGGREGFYKTTNGGGTWEIANQGLTAIFPWSLETVPDQPDVVFARTNTVDAYKGKRGGKTWQRLPIKSVSSILVDPVKTTRIYAGTNVRVYISDDVGDTWPTFASIAVPEAYADCSSSVVFLLAIPTQPGTVLAGVGHDLDVCFPTKGSIYRSTDYGEHWDRVYPIQPQESSWFSDLAFDVGTPTVVYAATGDGMLKSSDAGQSWEPMGAGITALDNVSSITVEPSPPYRVFVSTEVGFGEGLYLSEDQGSSWRQADSPLVGWQVTQILFAHGDPPVLYVSSFQGLFRSTDGAKSWQRPAGLLGYLPIYSLAVVTATNRVVLYAGTTGGFVESGEAQVLSLANDGGTLVNAGVYRYTTRRLWQLYLPNVFKAYSQ